MRWKDLRRSENVRDERGMGGAAGAGGCPSGAGSAAASARWRCWSCVFVVGGPNAVLQLLE